MSLDAPTSPEIPWRRCWVGIGETPALENGYLIPADARDWNRPRQNANLNYLDDLATVPCLVLVGPPGLGKSHELRVAHVRACKLSSDADRELLYVDLKTHGELSFREEVFESHAYLGWERGEHPLTLFLDSLDECWARIGALIPTLMSKLRRAGLGRAGHPPLLLRLGCRAAEWRNEELTRLRAAFDDPDGKKSRVQIHQLCPLTREDVLQAAIMRGLSSSAAFLRELDDLDLGSLASHPLTLELLLADSSASRPIGPTRAAVYRRGLLRLSHDAHEQPSTSPRNPHTTIPERRYHIATRIAALGVMSRRYLCRLPNAFGETSEQVLEVEAVCDCASGDGITRIEAKPLPAALAETYRSGLFRPAPESCVTWQHQAYAEFLAAEFLAGPEHTTSPVALRDLLGLIADLSAPSPQVFPPLEELALWLIELRPELFEYLLAGNAELLLRCDAVTLTAERRARIVENYFTQIRRHDVEGQDWEQRLPLERLAHPSLVEQLRQALLNPTESSTVRRTAISIAHACSLFELAPDLIKLVFNPGEDGRVAQLAAGRLRDWAGAPEIAGQSIRQAVRERLLATGGFERDELRGTILSILWPDHLSAVELIPYLTEADSDRRLGMYELFLNQELATRAHRAQIPILLRWAAHAGLGDDRHQDKRIGAVHDLARRAFDDTDDTSRDALVELALKWDTYKFPQILHVERGVSLDPRARRRFITAWLPHVRDFRSAFSRLRGQECPVLSPDDLAWAVEQALLAHNTDGFDAWIELVSWLTHWHGIQSLEIIEPLFERSAKLESYRQTRTTCRIDIPADENWEKKEFSRQAELAAKRAPIPPLEDRLSNALNHFDAGKLGAMFFVADRLFVAEEDGPHSSVPSEGQADVISASLSSAFHERLREATTRYWDEAEVITEEVLRTDLSYKKYSTALWLLSYTIRQESDWLERRSLLWWRKWLLVLVRYEHWYIGKRETFWPAAFALAHSADPVFFVQVLEQWLGINKTIHLDVTYFSSPSVASDPAVWIILRSLIQRYDAGSANRGELAGLLLHNGDHELEDWLYVTANRNSDSHTDRRAPIATALLLQHRAETEANRIAHEMAEDGLWARMVLYRLNSLGEVQLGWLKFVSPAILAQLWETLNQLVPDDPWENSNDGTVTPDHDLHRLGSYLLNHLNSLHSAEAVAAVESLISRRPEHADWLGRILARVRRARRRQDWQALLPDVAARFLDGLAPRPIATLGDLCDAVLASLAHYQSRLIGLTPPTELWNEPTREGRKYWEPKDENVLSNCLANHLRSELSSLNVMVEREVEVRRGTAAEPGDNPDLVILAPNPCVPADHLRLYLEVKCAWNVEAITGLGEQLFDRYLRTAECGIYLLAHHNCPTWDAPNDPRKNRALNPKPKAEVAAQLQSELERLRRSGTEKRLEGFFLDAAR